MAAIKISPSELARTIDHTLLKPYATENDIKELCREACQHGFYSVCVNPARVAAAAKFLKESPEIVVCSVVGFPLGASSTAVKIQEALGAVADGAGEIDMVINLGLLKEGRHEAVRDEIQSILKAFTKKVILKVIIETCHLTPEEKKTACLLAAEAGAHFVKTSTGFGTGGAEIDDVKMMRRTVPLHMGVKASGGIKTLAQALDMLGAGASRLGTSSGIAIMREYSSQSPFFTS